MSRSAPADCAMASTQIQTSSSNEQCARFPRLEECAHFHYGRVSLGGLRVSSSPAAKAHQDDDGDLFISYIIIIIITYL